MNPYASAITLILPTPSSPKQTQIFVSQESRLFCRIILGAQLGTRDNLQGWDGMGRGVKFKREGTYVCPTLCDPMVFRVHGILQARILE